MARPVKFKSKEEIIEMWEEYYKEQCQKAAIADLASPILTMSGLARRLGLSRQGLIDYSKKEEFFDTIKELREMVHESVEERLLSGVAQTGSIFNLKNNFGWKDKTEQEVSSTVKSIVVRDNRDKEAIDDLDSI